MNPSVKDIYFNEIDRLNNKKGKFWYNDVFLILISIFFSITIVGLILPGILVYKKRNIELQIKKVNSDENFINILEELKNKELNLVKKEKEQLLIEIKELDNQYKKIKEDKEKELEIELDSFIQNNLDNRYIERRNTILLEEFEYEPIEYRYSVSQEYKQKFKDIDEKEKEWVKKNKFISFTKMTENHWEKKKELNKFLKVILGGFNKTIEHEINSVTVVNIKSKKKNLYRKKLITS